MAIYYEELEGSPTFHFGPGEGSAERKFWLPDWGKLQQFVALFMNINFRLTTTNAEIYARVSALISLGRITDIDIMTDLRANFSFDIFAMLISYDSVAFPDNVAVAGAVGAGTLTIRTIILALIAAEKAVFFIQRGSMPGYPILLVNDVKIEPMIGDAIVYGTTPNYYYRGAKVTVGYKSDSPNSFQHKLKHAVDVITYPGSTLVWNDGKQAGTDIHGGVLAPHIEHDLTWRYILSPPWKAIRDCLGKVNDKVLFGTPKECMLFLGAETEIEYVAGLALGYKMTYKMSEKNNGTVADPKGWNHFLRPDAQPSVGFERLNVRPGNRIYEMAALERLFFLDINPDLNLANVEFG